MSSSPPAPDRLRVLAALHEAIADELRDVEAAMQAAVDEATSAESKAENKYDTRATEAAYLAAGQGTRALALRQQLARLTSAEAPDRLYGLRAGSHTRWYLLSPDGGGRRLVVDGHEVTVITMASPLGELLVDAEPGDTVPLGPSGAPHLVLAPSA